ncbi:MAG: hypothetical protein AAGJ90_14085 [Pseudomonadota bacterium]
MNPQLKHHSVFYSKHSLVGLPVPIFALAFVVSSFGIGLFISGFGIVLGGVFGALMATLVFRPLQAIHRHDLSAWRLWIRSLKASRFTGHIVKKKAVYVETQQHTVTFQQWSHFK